MSETVKIVAIIQARIGSTRLPGKILKEVNGKTLLEYQIERVKRSSLISDVIIATTTNKKEEPLVQLCERIGIKYFRGSEQDVLERYYETAQAFNADVIVRLTSDCPLIDPNIIDEVIQFYLNNQNVINYCSNTLERTYPRGLDVEVFSFKALRYTHLNASLARDREHVTSYIYTNPTSFQIAGITNEEDFSNYRWTVDTFEDFVLISKILRHLYPINNEFLLKDLIELLKENPSWNNINANIEQKKL